MNRVLEVDDARRQALGTFDDHQVAQSMKSRCLNTLGWLVPG